MNALLDLRILGWLLLFLGGFELLPVGVALIYHEPTLPYLSAVAPAWVFALAILLSVRTTDRRIRPRDGFVVVGVGWILLSAFGALPYLTTGALGPVDALFESVSGFTTTGSSVMKTVEDAPRALLFWRALTQWIGGMGIIVFTVAILPLLGIGGMQLFKAEVPGPVKDKVSPRVSETAKRLWLVYVGLTATQCVALVLAGMGPFDALCHSFTTLATGGFSNRDLSVGAYASPAVEWIISVFMLLAGMNFVLHYRTLTGRGREVLGESELRYYLWVAGGATLLVWAMLPGEVGGIEAGLRTSLFQVASILTTTGYATADFERWPSLAQLVLLQLMILGGMSGSTAGGIKSLRALIGFRAMRIGLAQLVHPHAVRPVKYGGKPVDADVLAGVWAFLTGYFLIAGVAAALVAAAGYDLVTAVSAALTSLGNVGPGLGEVGPMENFAGMPGGVKLALSACMLAGRLEVFTLLVLLQPGFWRK